MGLDVREDDTSAGDRGGLREPRRVRIPSRREGAPTDPARRAHGHRAGAGPARAGRRRGAVDQPRTTRSWAPTTRRAVAVLVELARRVASRARRSGWSSSSPPARRSASAAPRAFDLSAPAEHASATSSTTRRRSAQIDRRRADALPLRGDVPRPVRARRGPPRGGPVSAVHAAARPSPRCRHGRIDAETTANVASIERRHGVRDEHRPRPLHDHGRSAARSTTPARRRRSPRSSTPSTTPRTIPPAPVDVDVTSERHFRGFRLRPGDPAGRRGGARPARLRPRRPSLIPTGGASDANAFIAARPARRQPRQRHRAQPPARRARLGRRRSRSMLDVVVRAARRVRRGGSDPTCLTSSASTARPSTTAASSTS